MTEKMTRRQHTAQELSSGQVVNDSATCIHAYTVPTPNANVAPMKCTRNMVSTCRPIRTHGYSNQSECTITRDVIIVCLECFDAVGWAAGRASGL